MSQQGKMEISSNQTSSEYVSDDRSTEEYSSITNENEKTLDVDIGSVQYTKRYVGGVILLLVLFSVGVMAFHPAAIVSGVGVIVFVLLNISRIPKPVNDSDIRVTRNVTPSAPKPGDSVTVSMGVTNISDGTLSDIRLIDVVPSELSVIDGSPRAVNSLRPDETVGVEYTVKARRGEFKFNGFNARIRSIGGGMWRDIAVQENPPSLFDCNIRSSSVPIEEQGTDFIGALLGDKSGEGLEFDKTREYHHGDSPRRINWRDLAKRNELSTVVYREQQTTTVTVVLDMRDNTHIQTVGNTVPLPDLLLTTTYEIATALLQQNHNVGFTGIGITDNKKRETMGEWAHVSHQMGNEQKHRLLDVLDGVDVNYGDNTGKSDVQSNFIHRFLHEQDVWAPNNNQYIVISPLFDDTITSLSEELHKRSVNATIIVPLPPIAATGDVLTTDVITHTDIVNTNTKQYNQPPNHPQPVTLDEVDANSVESNSRRYMRLKQRKRIKELRSLGITVIEWPLGKSLSKAAKQQTKHTDTTI